MSTAAILAFIFGTVFVSALLVIAIFIPAPTSTQMFIFRVVLSLAAAGVGAVLPGIIDFNVNLPEGALQSGGALALFLIVYKVNPPKLVTNP